MRILSVFMVFHVLGIQYLLADEGDRQKALQFLQADKIDEAISLLQSAMTHSDDFQLRLLLASAYHAKGEYEQALVINQSLSSNPAAAATSFYNQACALSRLQRLDEAKAALIQAKSSGFLDFDLMASDPDLELLRRTNSWQMPPEHEAHMLTARNGLEIGYKLALPKGFDPKTEYKALVLFPPGDGPHTADWAIQNLVGDDEVHDWIVIYPLAPKQGWFTHPSHHALNDMLERLRSIFRIKMNKFYLAGFGYGARVASTYASMSGEFFISLTTFSACHWDRWDDEVLTSGFGIPARVVIGERDEFAREQTQRLQSLHAKSVEIKLVSDQGPMLSNLRNQALLDSLYLLR